MVLWLISMNVITTHVWLNQRLFGSLAIWCIYFVLDFLRLLGCFCWLVIVPHIPFPPCLLSCLWCYSFANDVQENYSSSLCRVYRWDLNKRLVDSFLQREYVHFLVKNIAFARVNQSGKIVDPSNVFWYEFADGSM